MNAYGELAEGLWRAADERRFLAMERRDDFFAELGLRVEHRVAELVAVFAGDTPAGETLRHRDLRMRRAKKRAEELAFEELIFSQTVEPDEVEVGAVEFGAVAVGAVAVQREFVRSVA